MELYELFSAVVVGAPTGRMVNLGLNPELPMKGETPVVSETWLLWANSAQGYRRAQSSCW